MKVSIFYMCIVLFGIQYPAFAEGNNVQKRALKLLESLVGDYPPSSFDLEIAEGVGEVLRNKKSSGAQKTIKKLKNGNPMERGAYVSVLTGDTSSEAFEQIKESLNDESYMVRDAALASLAGNNSPEAMRIIADSIERYKLEPALKALVGNYTPRALELINQAVSSLVIRPSGTVECSVTTKCYLLKLAIEALEGHESPKAFSIMERIAKLSINGEGGIHKESSYTMQIHKELFSLVAGNKSPEALKILKLLSNRKDVLKSLVGNTSLEALDVIKSVWRYSIYYKSELNVLALDALQGHESPEAFELLNKIIRDDIKYGSTRAAAVKVLGGFVN